MDHAEFGNLSVRFRHFLHEMDVCIWFSELVFRERSVYCIGIKSRLVL